MDHSPCISICWSLSTNVNRLFSLYHYLLCPLSTILEYIILPVSVFAGHYPQMWIDYSPYTTICYVHFLQSLNRSFSPECTIICCIHFPQSLNRPFSLDQHLLYLFSTILKQTMLPGPAFAVSTFHTLWIDHFSCTSICYIHCPQSLNRSLSVY